MSRLRDKIMLPKSECVLGPCCSWSRRPRDDNYQQMLASWQSSCQPRPCQAPQVLYVKNGNMDPIENLEYHERFMREAINMVSVFKKMPTLR